MNLYRLCLIYSVLSFTISSLVQSADAVLIEFEEYASVTEFVNGETFTVSGVDFESFPLIGTSGAPQNTPVRIGISSEIGFGPNLPIPGGGNVIYPRSVLMDFDGNIGRQSFVSIPFYNSGGTVNLWINGTSGDAPLVARGGGVAAFQAFDGLTVNGVSIDIVGISASHGRIDLTGPIDRVLFGGQEAIFDNISTTPIPEPSTLLLAGLGMVAFCRRFRA